MTDDELRRLRRTLRRIGAAVAQRDEMILVARDAGLSAIEIGELLGITRYRVHQVLREHGAVSDRRKWRMTA